MSRPGQAPGAPGVNQLGGRFVNGCPLPADQRERIVEMASWGLRATDISWHLKVSIGCVSKILCQYHRTRSVQPEGPRGSRPRSSSMREEVAARIAQMKQAQPSLFAWEIRRQLQADSGACGPDQMPSVSSIHRILRRLQTDMRPPEQWAALTQCLETGGRSIGSSVGPPQAPPAHPLGTPKVMGLSRAAGKPQRGRTAFSTRQLGVLEQAFQSRQYLEAATREKLASATGLPGTTIRVWFSNRRARGRREAQALLETTDAAFLCQSYLLPGHPSFRELPAVPWHIQPPFRPHGPSRTEPLLLVPSSGGSHII